MSDEFDPFKLGKGLKEIKNVSNSKKISGHQAKTRELLLIRSFRFLRDFFSRCAERWGTKWDI